VSGTHRCTDQRLGEGGARSFWAHRTKLDRRTVHRLVLAANFTPTSTTQIRQVVQQPLHQPPSAQGQVGWGAAVHMPGKEKQCVSGGEERGCHVCSNSKRLCCENRVDSTVPRMHAGLGTTRDQLGRANAVWRRTGLDVGGQMTGRQAAQDKEVVG
jgi:hypothetical protein